MADSIKKTGLAAAAMEHPETFIKYARGAERFAYYYNASRPYEYRDMNIIVIYGPTRTGKTRYVYENETDVYACHSYDNFMFEGYIGQKVVLMDEFRATVPCMRMLQLLDGHPCSLNVKGGSTPARYTTVYLVTNENPATWYLSVPPETRAAFYARITKMYRFSAQGRHSITDDLDP